VMDPITALKAAGTMTVPPLSEGVKSAIVLNWKRGWRDKVSAGDVLVVLKTTNGTVEIRAPISGYLARQSVKIGMEVRVGNKLGDVECEQPQIYRVRVRRVQPIGLPECVRIDYVRGFTLSASEWVCPDAPGTIGAKGRSWWVDRVGYVPPSAAEAEVLARALPPPDDIVTLLPARWQETLDHPYGGGPAISRLVYSAPLKTGLTTMSGDNSVFLDAEDERELKTCKVGVALAPPSNVASIEYEPPPSWWPRIVPGNAEVVPLDPPDRRLVPPDVAKTIREVLYRSRQFAQSSDGISFRQAICNLCMAYTISEPPTIVELQPLFPSVWPSKDIIIQHHMNALAKRLEEAVAGQWLSNVIDPLVKDVRLAGRLNTRLVWAAQGYLFDNAWIPCLDIELVFWSALGGRPRAGHDLDTSQGNSAPTFTQALHNTLRECINTVRVDLGLPKIGEGWLTETDLYQRVRRLFPNEEVIHHGRTRWLGRQHLDIWMPSRNVAIEYQGEQHTLEIGFFGGREGLARTRERDERKRALCRASGVRLIEIHFNDDLRDEWIQRQILQQLPAADPG